MAAKKKKTRATRPKRRRAVVKYSLSPACTELVAELASTSGLSRSAMIEVVVRDYARRRLGLDVMAEVEARAGTPDARVDSEEVREAAAQVAADEAARLRKKGTRGRSRRPLK